MAQATPSARKIKRMPRPVEPLKTHPPKESRNYRSQARAGTESIRNLQVRLTSGEAMTYRRADPVTLGLLLGRVASEGLPRPTALPRSTGITVRVAALPVRAEHIKAVKALLRADRSPALRAALAVLAAEHAAGRYQVATATHPGTPQQRKRMSVGGGRWVVRAVWRRADSFPRAGDRGPNSLLYASARQVGLEHGDLFELVDDDWKVLDLFTAQHLHAAAEQVVKGLEERVKADPDRLLKPRTGEGPSQKV